MPVDASAPVVEARRRDAVDDESSTPRPPTLVPHPEPAPAPARARPAPSLPRAQQPAPSPAATQPGGKPVHEPIEHRPTQPSTPRQIDAITERGSREPARPAPNRDRSRVTGVDPSSPMATSVSLEAPVQPTAVLTPPVPRVDAAPSVSIGEIHVHVAAPAGPNPDPLALLAPYADGITARRAGAR